MQDSERTSTAGRVGRWAGPAVWGLSWGLILGGLVCAGLAWGDDQTLPFEIHREFFVLDAIIAGIYGPASAVVLRRVRHPVGWLLALVAVAFAASGFGMQYAVLGASRPDLPAYSFFVHLTAAAWVVGAFAVVLVLPWLLDRTVPRGLRRVAAGIGAALAVFAFGTRMLIQTPDGPFNPLAPSPEVSRWAYDVDAAIIPFYFLYALAGAAFLVVRHRRATDDDRRGLGWVIVSVLLVAVAYIAFEVGLSLGGPLLSIAAMALFAAQIMLPAAVIALVARQPQWGVDLAVSRATVWGLLTAGVVAVYLALVWVAGRVFPIDQDESGVIVVAVVALAVTPVRRWVQGRVDRLIYGSVTDAEILLSRLGADLSREPSDRSSLESLADGLRHSMRLASVGIESLPAVSTVSVVAGERGRQGVAVPLLMQGREVGTMKVAPRRGQRLDPRTLRVLEQISGLVAAALELAQVNEQLDTARTRILDVRHEERRVLRRELHDGLGPALAGASLALAAIGNNNPGIRTADAQLLAHLQEELSRRADDLRGIARALLPPALDDGRLRDALGVLAALFGDTRLAVLVEADGADSIDTRRQVAIYHIAAEAVFNTFRHAQAATCRVRVECDADGPVRLTVADDGRGMVAVDQPGIGLASMRERAAELGGSLTVSDSQDGTTIEVVLP